MNQVKRLFAFVSIFVVISLLLTACGGGNTSPLPAPPPGVNLGDVKAFWDKLSDHYHTGVNTYEKNATNLFREYENTFNEFYAGSADLVSLNASCYKDAKETETAIGKAVMGTENAATIARSLTTGSVSGEAATVECIKITRQLADYVISHRSEVRTAADAAFQAATDYKSFTSNYPEVQWMNDLLKTYLSPQGVYTELAKHGIGVTNWTWLPTKNLWVSHQDKALCDYYMSGAFKSNLGPDELIMYTGHDDSLRSMYEAVWNPAAFGGRGECRMYREAALDYMTRSVQTTNTRNAIQNGEDTSVIPTTGPSTVEPR